MIEKEIERRRRGGKKDIEKIEGEEKEVYGRGSERRHDEMRENETSDSEGEEAGEGRKVGETEVYWEKFKRKAERMKEKEREKRRKERRERERKEENQRREWKKKNNIIWKRIGIDLEGKGSVERRWIMKNVLREVTEKMMGIIRTEEREG